MPVFKKRADKKLNTLMDQLAERLHNRQNQLLINKFDPILDSSNVSLRANQYPVLKTPIGQSVVNLFKDTISTLPIRLQTEIGDDAERIYTTPPKWIINPTIKNPNYTSEMLISGIVDSLILAGNAFLVKAKDESGDIQGLYLLDPSRIEIYGDIIEPQYKIINNVNSAFSPKTEENFLGTDDILHLALRAPAGHIVGISPFNEAAAAVDLINKMYLSNRSLFNNFLAAANLVNVEVQNEEEEDKVREEIKDQLQGADKAGAFLVLFNAGVDVKTLSFNPEQKQLVESLNLAINDIARCLRVPPALANIVAAGSMSYASNAAQMQSFATRVLAPFVKIIEAGFSTMLPPNQKIILDLDGLTQGDRFSQWQAGVAAVGGAFMTRNELRALTDLPSIEGGDELLQPLNSAGISEADSIVEEEA